MSDIILLGYKYFEVLDFYYIWMLI